MRRISNNAVGLFVYVSLLCSTGVQAAVIYVGKDHSCPGSGTSASPYCSIQNAFNKVRAGDTILIRDGATPYNENAILTTTGTSGSVITITKDSGHNPTIRLVNSGAQQGAIQLQNVSYVTVDGLNFDATSTASSRYALMVYNSAGPLMTNITVQNNTFAGWGSTAAATAGAAAVAFRSSFGTKYNAFPISGIIRNNTFVGNRGHAIALRQTNGVMVTGNTITGNRCAITNAKGGYLEAAGIKIGNEAQNTTIYGNHIHSFEKFSDCDMPIELITAKSHVWAGIYCDAGGINSIIEGNEIHDVDYPQSLPIAGADSVGIFIESRCHNWTVRRNAVYRIGQKGIRNGSAGTGNPDNTVYENNSFSQIGEVGIWIARGKNITVRNNIIAIDPATGVTSIEFTSTAVALGPHVVNYNLYWDGASGSKIGRWGDYTTRNLTNWRQSCNCDSKTLSTDPQFIISPVPGILSNSENLRLSSSSPARGAGDGGIDLGAYPSVSSPTSTSRPFVPVLKSVK